MRIENAVEENYALVIYSCELRYFPILWLKGIFSS